MKKPIGTTKMLKKKIKVKVEQSELQTSKIPIKKKGNNNHARMRLVDSNRINGIHPVRFSTQ